MNRTITGAQLRGIFLAKYDVPLHFTALVVDNVYALLSDDQAAAFFGDRARLTQKFYGEWQEEVGDCDDYAMTCRTFALMAHRKHSKVKAGLVFGVMSYYRAADSVRHAINFVITSRMENQEQVFSVRTFEPESGRELHLTRQERASVNWIHV